MFILRLIKSPKYFYSLMAILFIVFINIILFTGRNIYTGEQDKLFASHMHELTTNKKHFEASLDDINLEARRIVNIMKDMNMLNSLDDLEIKSFLSDLLFDHHYLSVIIFNNNASPLLRVNSQTISNDNLPFANTDSNQILSRISEDKKNTHAVHIDKDLNVIYLVKTIPDSFGNSDKRIAFFFAPELLFKHLPKNYGFIHESSKPLWSVDETIFPKKLKYKINTLLGRTRLSDTTSLIYSALSGKNNKYYLSALLDTSELKTSLFYNTIISVAIFSLFFSVILFLIYFRNIQISQLIETQKATVVCLANLAEFKDNETADHLERTRHYGTLLAKKLKSLPEYKHKISKEYLDNIGFASVLHDIGKVGIPDEVLKKPGKLNTVEFEIIKNHTSFAKDILQELVDKHKINDIFFTLSYNIATYHHEKWDGSGYPAGLAGESIPLEARIFALCDVYDALRSERPYKDAFSHEVSMSIINEGKGTHFDPIIIDIFNECADKFKYIHDTYVMFYEQIDYGSFGNNKRELQVVWDDKLSVGIDSIDNQHKILLNKVNFLIKSILEGKGNDSIINILNFLRNYSEEHFLLEEDIMRKQNHPDFEMHTKAHNTFRQSFEKIIANIDQEGIQTDTLEYIETYLIKWLLNHITEMDANLKLDNV